MRLYYAINEELKPAVRAVSSGISLQAVLAPALPPVPTIAELLLVRPRLPPAVTSAVWQTGVVHLQGHSVCFCPALGGTKLPAKPAPALQPVCPICCPACCTA